MPPGGRGSRAVRGWGRPVIRTPHYSEPTPCADLAPAHSARGSYASQGAPPSLVALALDQDRGQVRDRLAAGSRRCGPQSTYLLPQVVDVRHVDTAASEIGFAVALAEAERRSGPGANETIDRILTLGKASRSAPGCAPPRFLDRCPLFGEDMRRFLRMETTVPSDSPPRVSIDSEGSDILTIRNKF